MCFAWQLRQGSTRKTPETQPATQTQPEIEEREPPARSFSQCWLVIYQRLFFRFRGSPSFVTGKQEDTHKLRLFYAYVHDPGLRLLGLQFGGVRGPPCELRTTCLLKPQPAVQAKTSFLRACAPTESPFMCRGRPKGLKQSCTMSVCVCESYEVVKNRSQAQTSRHRFRSAKAGSSERGVRGLPSSQNLESGLE